MSRRPPLLLPLPLVLCVIALGASACGGTESEGTDPAESGPVKVGALSVDVLSSRYLDRGDQQDAAYLVGQPPAGIGSAWFGVFLEMKNEGNSTVSAPAMTIEDSAGQSHSAFPTDNPKGFSFGETIGPNESLPKPGAEGQSPDNGTLLIFRLDQETAANQPLTLHIQGFGAPEVEVELEELRP